METNHITFILIEENNENVLAGYDNSPYGLIMTKLNIFQNLMLEMSQKL